MRLFLLKEKSDRGLGAFFFNQIFLLLCYLFYASIARAKRQNINVKSKLAMSNGFGLLKMYQLLPPSTNIEFYSLTVSKKLYV